MSFLFKSKQKSAGGATPNALPAATRDIRSSDGSNNPASSINGVVGGPNPSSPTPGTSINSSLNSLAGNEKTALATAPVANGRPSQSDLEEKAAFPRQESVSRGSGPPSPEQKSLRDRSQEPTDLDQRMQQSRATTMQAPRPPPNDISPYPWSQRRLTFTVSHTNPFPRYGAAVNASASKEGAIYLMGGLINGSTVKGDLWMVDAGSGNMSCFPVATTSEGPGPRVGHASLLVGNAFIVFGGDTKMDEGDSLDDTLYLLNTSTKQWSRSLPAGTRPPGRYGHTLNILGSKIYVFGGQVEGYFFNDLMAFDLNALQQANNRWEILIQNTIDGGPPHGQIPPARTNHTMVSHGDKLYLFGGTDGVHWFNDVWAYSPHTNSWSQLECIGYIPSPREGHATALVGDVMYIFGGRTEEGNDLGDLAAFRITSRRWYTFQNMGLSPSPRSGHSMTTVGKSIVVLAGEPSSAPRDTVELGMGYFLDTSKIRYPADSISPAPINERIGGARQPTGEKNVPPGSQGRSQSKDFMDRDRAGSVDARMRGDSASRLPRAVGPQGQPLSPAPSGPPPQAPPQTRTNGVLASRQPTRPPDRAFSPSVEAERSQPFERNGIGSPQTSARQSPVPRADGRTVMSPAFNGEDAKYYDGEQSQAEQRRYIPETYQPSQEQSTDGLGRSISRGQRQRIETRTEAERLEETPRRSADAPDQIPKVRQVQHDEHEGPQDSGIGSSPALTQQHDELARELDRIKQKNAWYVSELALAKKSGYQTRAPDSPIVDERTTDSFADDDKPLIEALLRMRAELARVQDTIDQQSKTAASRIAEIEKQRDAAISEAVYAKAKLASQGSPQLDSEGKRNLSDGPERNNEMSRRLASSLAAQSELSGRIDGLIQEIEAERRGRQLAEDTAEAAQKRVTELDVHRQQHTSEIEGLRSELHETQKQHREISANHTELSSQHQMLTVDNNELSSKLDSALTDTQNHTSLLTSLRDAVTASTQKAELLEQKLDEERGERELLEQKHQALKAEHDESSADLENTTRRLKDAEEMASKNAEEARTHRAAVLAGLGNITDRDSKSSSAADERVAILRQQVEAANAVTRQNQAAADAASEKLRRAEERIAGLEAYQEQASREGLSIRKQLQATLKESQGLSLEKSGLEQKIQSQMLETNALAVQHSSLKDILSERGINVADLRRSKAVDSPSSLSNRFSTPDLSRVRELEQQLEASSKSHDDMRTQFEEVSERDEKMKREYEEKLTALDNDHQAAVKYLRGTEKMLSKMKQELQRVKNENGELKKRMEKGKEEGDVSRRGTPAGLPENWEQERDDLRKEIEQSQAELKASVTNMETRIATMQEQLQTTESQLEQAKTAHDATRGDLSALQTTHSQSQSDIERMRTENATLEERARDAENKVQLLLDQVEHSVDNYRRQSRIGGEGTTTTMNGVLHRRSVSEASDGTTTNTLGGVGHARNTSDGGNSLYSITEDGGADGRNSLALDSLASELDALRSHWETTNKNYRLSDRFDFERTPTAAHPPPGPEGGFGGHLASWRHGLDLGDEDEDPSRPGTSEGTVRGHGSRQGSVSEPHHGDGSPNPTTSGVL